MTTESERRGKKADKKNHISFSGRKTHKSSNFNVILIDAINFFIQKWLKLYYFKMITFCTSAKWLSNCVLCKLIQYIKDKWAVNFSDCCERHCKHSVLFFMPPEITSELRMSINIMKVFRTANRCEQALGSEMNFHVYLMTGFHIKQIGRKTSAVLYLMRSGHAPVRRETVNIVANGTIRSSKPY